MTVNLLIERFEMSVIIIIITIIHVVLFVLFIAHQHAMHAERDIFVPIPSVRLSVQCRYCV